MKPIHMPVNDGHVNKEVVKYIAIFSTQVLGWSIDEEELHAYFL
jgi:hypothetical protein